MSAQPAARIAPEQYLELEERAAFKSEYYDGCVYAMAGGSFEHAVIGANIIAALGPALRHKACYVLSSDAMLAISTKHFTYPDVMIVCGSPEFGDNKRRLVTNPTVVFEVLSAFTEAYDRGFKFQEYRKLESLREYVLISQSEARVERFVRQPDQWGLTEISGLDAKLRLDSVDCEIVLSEIYAKVTFAESLPLARPAETLAE